MVELGPRLFDALGEARGRSTAIEWQNLFEPMVRALAHDPRKLDDIARLVRDLERTEAGRALLPDDWYSDLGADLRRSREGDARMSEPFDPKPVLDWAQGLPAQDRRLRVRAALRTVASQAVPGRR